MPPPFKPGDLKTCGSSFPLKSTGAPLSFAINGRAVTFNGHGTKEFKLNCHPPGSATGFTTVQHIKKEPSEDVSEAAPEPVSVPVISGVFSGLAAKKVLNDLDLNVNTSTKRDNTPIEATKRFHRGQLSHIPPSKCGVCMSSFKVVKELRGFMCRCSPFITQSLNELKKMKLEQSSRERRKKRKKSSGDFKNSRKSTVSPVQKSVKMSEVVPIEADPFSSIDVIEGLKDLPLMPESKLVTTVDDYYYNSSGGPTSDVASQHTGTYKCIICYQMLSSNIELMSHMKKHATKSAVSEAISSCSYCLRRFHTPLKLKGHLNDVHLNHPCPVKCKICELVFDSEGNFLHHMKTTHEPGEMPYVCQVCNFRSSFFLDVWFHFERFHANTKHLLCQYCLRVLHSSSCYQRHFIRHQKKSLLSCDQCRLHFLYVNDRIAHKLVHHCASIKPTHLATLKTGTKISVRVYSRRSGSNAHRTLLDQTEGVYVEEKVSIAENKEQRKEFRSRSLFLNFEIKGEDDYDTCHCCVECLNSVYDFTSHFPSVVHCSLCDFTTCCSRAYANHMINNHSHAKKYSQYCTIFQSPPRLKKKLMCGVCSFQTWRGDVMANHLLEEEEHSCITNPEPNVYMKRRLSEMEDDLAGSISRKSSCRGSFVPIELVSPQQLSSKLSVTLHTSLSFSSRPAMTIRFKGATKPRIGNGVSQTMYELSVILFSLCNGIPQASQLFNWPPIQIRKWTAKRKKELACRWHWDTEKLLLWLLGMWEQQLHVSQSLILEEAKVALGDTDIPVMDCFSWTVDFLLYHRLDLHNHRKCLLPQSVMDEGSHFIQSLCAKVEIGSLSPGCVGFMDELPIFIHMGDQHCTLSNFHLVGLPAELPLFEVVLSGLADGTFFTPLLFFRGNQPRLPKGFPNNVLLQAVPPGSLEQDRLSIWTNQVWRHHAAANPQSLLILDTHRHHQTEKFQSELSELSTETLFLPQSCSSLGQPLAVCVMPVLKDFLQARWTQLQGQRGLESLSLDQLAQTMTCWLSEVTSILRAQKHFLSRSFAEVCQLQPNTESAEAALLVQTLTDTLCK